MYNWEGTFRGIADKITNYVIFFDTGGDSDDPEFKAQYH
jgi:hypothetical protein